eukprot:1095413-Amphidinium_carterae.1
MGLSCKSLTSQQPILQGTQQAPSAQRSVKLQKPLNLPFNPPRSLSSIGSVGDFQVLVLTPAPPSQLEPSLLLASTLVGMASMWLQRAVPKSEKQVLLSRMCRWNCHPPEGRLKQSATMHQQHQWTTFLVATKA